MDRFEVNISSPMKMNKFESNRNIFCIREAYTPQLRHPTDWYVWDRAGMDRATAEGRMSALIW